MKAPAALPFYLYDFGAIRPDSFLQGDSFKLLEGVQTETVDMVFIDPPYFIKKAEWDTFGNQQEYNDFMARAFWEAERILKPNGTLAFWHNDLQQVARLLCWLENWTQFVFNSWAVWVKPNFRKKLWANPGTGNTLRSWFNAKTAQDTADGKRRTFISTPVPPYDVGDLWAQGKDGALLACIKKKTGSQLYSADDWTDAANYTKAAEAILYHRAAAVSAAQNHRRPGVGVHRKRPAQNHRRRSAGNLRPARQR